MPKGIYKHKPISEETRKKIGLAHNLISLCQRCHMQTNYKREDWINYFNERMKYANI